MYFFLGVRERYIVCGDDVGPKPEKNHLKN